MISILCILHIKKSNYLSKVCVSFFTLFICLSHHVFQIEFSWLRLDMHLFVNTESIAKRHWARSLNQAFCTLSPEMLTTTIDMCCDQCVGRCVVLWIARLTLLTEASNRCFLLCNYCGIRQYTRGLYCDHYYIAFLKSSCIKFDCQQCNFIPTTSSLAFFFLVLCNKRFFRFFYVF